MAQEEIEIEISPTGKVTVRTIGIKGKRCLEAAEKIAELIGRAEERELTSEYYEEEQQVQRHLDIHNRE